MTQPVALCSSNTFSAKCQFSDDRHTFKSPEVRRDGYRTHVAADPATGIITAEKLTRAAGAEDSGAAVAAEFVAAVTGADGQDDGSGRPFAWYGDSAYGTRHLRAIPGECRSVHRCSRSEGTRARLTSPAAVARKEGAARPAPTAKVETRPMTTAVDVTCLSACGEPRTPRADQRVSSPDIRRLNLVDMGRARCTLSPGRAILWLCEDGAAGWSQGRPAAYSWRCSRGKWHGW